MRNAISESKPKSSDVSKGSNVDMNHSDDNKNNKRNKREFREEVSGILIKR